MCDVMVRVISNTHADPVKEQRSCYQAGAIVEIGPVGWDWGYVCLGPGHSWES